VDAINNYLEELKYELADKMVEGAQRGTKVDVSSVNAVIKLIDSGSLIGRKDESSEGSEDTTALLLEKLLSKSNQASD
jgi:hypothetical protein